MSDSELDQLLKSRLPRHAAPAELRAKLAEQLSSTEAPTRASVTPIRARWAWPTASALAAAMLALLAVRVTRPTFAQRDTLVDEAVNDHLRVVSSQHPLDIESNGIHNVKPWFTGRLDFAPPVSFAGDADFPLRGGSVSYFGPHRAALFLFARRLHEISLFVLPSDNLQWPTDAATTTRGFHIVTWRANNFAYALVSDVSLDDLRTLQSRLR